MGLPHLSPKDRSFVNKHNVMFRRAMNWAKRHQKSGGSGYIENPLTSMLWKTRTVRSMINTGNCVLLRYDMCQYGTQYKKPTRLLCWGPWIQWASFKTCVGRSVCSRTARPHFSLTGIVDGVFRTSAAQVYPTTFTNHLAYEIIKSELVSPKPCP